MKTEEIINNIYSRATLFYDEHLQAESDIQHKPNMFRELIFSLQRVHMIRNVRIAFQVHILS